MMHKRVDRFVVLFIGFLLAGTTVFAQEKRSITMQEAIELSIKNSKQLKGSEARIDQATASLKEAVDRRLPDLNISGSYLRLNHADISMASKGSDNSNAQSPKPNAAVYGMANASLPLFSGFRIKYGIESARYLEQAVKLDAETDREDVIFNTIEAYNNLYKSKAAVDLVTENLQSAQQRVTEFSSLEKNGLLPRNELMKAELQASNTELALLDAQNNWKLSNINMDLMLGLPESTELVIDSAGLQMTASLKPIEEYVQSGLQNRKDLSSLAYRKKAIDAATKAAQGEKYPSLALTSGYVAADIPHLVTVTNAMNVGIGVQYSVSSLWKNKSKVQEAEAKEREVSANEELLSDHIRLQINQAYQTYLSGVKKIEVYKKAIEQANENYRITKNKFANSLATTTDLLDADVAQLKARLNYEFAKSDAVVAYNKLLQSAGLLSNRNTNN